MPAQHHAFAATPLSDSSVAPALSAARPSLPAAADFHNSTARLWTQQAYAKVVEKDESAPEGDVRRREILIHSNQDLVVRLCQMPVDLAAPLLRASLPSLDTPALLALIAATGAAHHRLVAQRSGLDWRVIKALLKSSADEVLLALAENHSLDFDDEDQSALARMAEDRVMLRAAILANPALSRARANLKVNAEDGLSHKNLKLVKLLRAGQSNAFVLEAAKRLDWEPTRLQKVLSGTSAAPLALLLCALGLDRTVFANLITCWQTAHDGEPHFTAAHKPLVLSVFSLAPARALQKLSAIAAI